ncbi:MAG: hypothetical protein IJ821_06280 [Lachnospiraceae bacterium]|nr:hypothetical protein [Lachnospiraceae bacterium]
MEKEKILTFTEEQLAFLKEYAIKPEASFETTQKLDLLLIKKGFDIDYNPTDIGTMCEDILDIIADYDNDEEYVDDFE